MTTKIKNVTVGQIIKTKEDYDTDKKLDVARKYKVIAIYPFHVLTKNATGIKRCFSYGHLVQMGLER